MTSFFPRRTERLPLRPLRGEDVDVILAYRNDAEVPNIRIGIQETDQGLPVTTRR